MRILDVVQGSEAWLHARLGIPTASQADKILTPARLKPSSSAASYRTQLLAEWVQGYPIDWSGQSQFMERGTDLEPEARAAYELETDADVTTVGLCVRDDGLFAGSPDGLVGDDGGLEIKCAALHTHIGYMLDPSSLAAEYRGQPQALMYLTGRAWWDLWAYHPELPAVRVRIERDPEYVAAFAPALDAFIAELLRGREMLEPHRRTPPTVEAVAAAGMSPDHAGDLTALLGDAAPTRRDALAEG